MKRRSFLIGLPLAGLVAAGVFYFGRAGAEPKPPINDLRTPGLAIDGYDPVAYFLDARPVKGNDSFSLRWRGSEWRFANDEHRRLFEADPSRYAPAYGGYCAYGAAQGYRVKIEPEAWSIRQGRLYLNYDLAVRDQWLEDPDGYIARADRNYPELTGG